jgi:hypothetical protein
LNPKVEIYQKQQMRSENIYYFMKKESEFKEDKEENQRKPIKVSATKNY